MPTNVSAIMVVVTHMLLASISQDRIGVCVKKDSKAMASHVLVGLNASYRTSDYCLSKVSQARFLIVFGLIFHEWFLIDLLVG